MRKSRALSALLAALSLAAPVAEARGPQAGIEIGPAADKLCAPAAWDQGVEGVWLEEDRAMLAFRVSWDTTGTACFAWLNAQPVWDIAAPGASTGQIRLEDGVQRFEDRNVIIAIDPDGHATFRNKRSMQRTPGVVTARLDAGAREAVEPVISTRSAPRAETTAPEPQVTARSGRWVRTGEGRWTRL